MLIILTIVGTKYFQIIRSTKTIEESWISLSMSNIYKKL